MKRYIAILFFVSACGGVEQPPTEQSANISANFEQVIYNYDEYRLQCEELVDEQGEIAYQQCLGYAHQPLFCETEKRSNRMEKLALFEQEIIRAQNNALNCILSFDNESYCLAIFENDLNFALTNCARTQYFY